MGMFARALGAAAASADWNGRWLKQRCSDGL